MNECDLTMVLCAYGENPFLEEAARSLARQSVPVKVMIATSTPSDHVERIARKFQFDYFVNPEKGRGIGADWEFAASCAKTRYVTIAHQDDIYFPDYAKNVLKAFEQYPDTLIVFTNNCDKLNGELCFNRSYLNIKRLLLWPYYLKKSWKMKLFKAAAYALGNAICCPSVTYNAARIGGLRFDRSYASNLDWQQWIDIAGLPGRFTYIKEVMVAHRIDETTATSSLIKDNRRYNEDLRIFTKIWGKTIAGFLMVFYKRSYKMAEAKEG